MAAALRPAAEPRRGRTAPLTMRWSVNKIGEGLGVLGELFAIRFFGRRRPFVVVWAITHRCNQRCAYCGLWKRSEPELSTQEALRIIDELSSTGTRKIIFTGGEPLLRDDLGRLVDHARRKNISVGLSTNGILFASRLPELAGLSYLSLSLEGPEEIHDALRGGGSFRKVLEAARAAKEKGMSLRFYATLNALNVDRIDDLLGLSDQYGAQIVFQPATANLLGGNEENPVCLPEEKYAEAIKKLLKAKKGPYAKTIRNSVTGLRHLARWPHLKPLKCAAGSITCRIEPDGTLSRCGTVLDRGEALLNCRTAGFREAFYRIPPLRCDQCCCALRVEANYVLEFDFATLISVFSSEN